MENRVKSVFGDYATQLGVLVFENANRFKEPFFPKFFNMGIPQPGLTYATAVGIHRIEGAAAVVAHGSESPLRSRPGLEKYSGEVAAIKVKRKMDESEYRNWLVMQNMPVSDETRKGQIIQLIWDDVKAVFDSTVSRLDIMCKQALSRGIVTINLANNPDGIALGDIDLLVTNREGITNAFGNTGTASMWNSPNSTPIADIVTLVQREEENNGLDFEKILMTNTKFNQVASTTEVTATLGVFPTLDEINTYLSDRQLPVIELVTGRHTIETNGIVSGRLNAWSNEYVTFVPSGRLGTVVNALAVEEISPVSGVDYALNNRVLISKWSQTEPFGEYTRGEIAAFPGFEAAGQVYMVNTEANAWA